MTGQAGVVSSSARTDALFVVSGVTEWPRLLVRRPRWYGSAVASAALRVAVEQG